MLAGFGLGAAAVQSLHAQAGKGPGAYVIVDITEINDPKTFKTLLPKAPQAVSAFGGHFVTRTENIIGLDGVPPLRFVIIAFDTMQKASSWSESAAQTEINDIRMKSTKSRSFIVAAEGKD
jgi:uncharacterized protein (DUF1330 family)